MKAIEKMDLFNNTLGLGRENRAPTRRSAGGAKTTPLQDVLPGARKPRPYKMFCLGRENHAPTRRLGV